MIEHPGGIVLFDGTCGFCEGAVRFIARRDARGYFRFAPSQWPQAQAALAARGLTREAARSLVLIEGDRVYLRSTASLRIAAHLTRPWRWARVLLWVPRPARDAVYGVVAAIRHRLAGRSTACDLPPPELRSRLIGDSVTGTVPCIDPQQGTGPESDRIRDWPPDGRNRGRRSGL